VGKDTKSKGQKQRNLQLFLYMMIIFNNFLKYMMKWIINILCIFATENQTLNIKTMKKVLFWLMAILPALAFTACGGDDDNDSSGCR
jgi:hypothetical protein